MLRYVATAAIRAAVQGREGEVLDALGVAWRSGNPHIRCPYPAHDDRDPSWRWDERRARAFCTCIPKSDSIFDVAGKVAGIDFEGAKLRVAEFLGRHDLNRVKDDNRGQRTDPASLLNPPAGSRDVGLITRYLGGRLGLEDPGAVPLPMTAVAGWKALGYYDPPETKGGKPKLISSPPCAVFATVAADGRRHAHRIYLAPDGWGKAELGVDAKGKQRDPKKSARVAEGQPSIAGCCVVWGDSDTATAILAEGIETAAAIAYALAGEIERNELVVLSAVNAVGIEAFAPWPATVFVIVAADRDEAKQGAGFKRGERAARALGLRLTVEGGGIPSVAVAIALPEGPGSNVDFLDLLLSHGPEAVRAAILAPVPFEPTPEEIEEFQNRGARRTVLETINATFPIPSLLKFRLEYRHTRSGEIWLHKLIKTDEDEDTGETTEVWLPICSPISPIARLRLLDEDDAYGMRVAIADMEGAARPIDFHRGELARLAASEIRARLMNGGLRVANGGEVTILELLKEAKPALYLDTAAATGWPDETRFISLDGEEFS
jgi:hypothetical protein